ncbi:MAG: hypothetical protein AAB316_02260 [Bacteroidota bacterium]
MDAIELKTSLHHLVDATEDIQVLRRVIAYFKALKEAKLEEWEFSDEELTRLAMNLSQSSFAEVWDNEEDEIWNNV